MEAPLGIGDDRGEEDVLHHLVGAPVHQRDGGHVGVGSGGGGGSWEGSADWVGAELPWAAGLSLGSFLPPQAERERREARTRERASPRFTACFMADSLPFL